MATRKSRMRAPHRDHGFDAEIIKEIDRQTQKQEIEDRRKKQKWFFWLLVCSGAVLIPTGITALLFLLLEW